MVNGPAGISTKPRRSSSGRNHASARKPSSDSGRGAGDAPGDAGWAGRSQAAATARTIASAAPSRAPEDSRGGLMRRRLWWSGRLSAAAACARELPRATCTRPSRPGEASPPVTWARTLAGAASEVRARIGPVTSPRHTRTSSRACTPAPADPASDISIRLRPPSRSRSRRSSVFGGAWYSLSSASRFEAGRPEAQLAGPREVVETQLRIRRGDSRRSCNAAPARCRPRRTHRRSTTPRSAIAARTPADVLPCMPAARTVRCRPGAVRRSPPQTSSRQRTRSQTAIWARLAPGRAMRSATASERSARLQGPGQPVDPAHAQIEEGYRQELVVERGAPRTRRAASTGRRRPRRTGHRSRSCRWACGARWTDR